MAANNYVMYRINIDVKTYPLTIISILIQKICAVR